MAPVVGVDHAPTTTFATEAYTLPLGPPISVPISGSIPDSHHATEKSHKIKRRCRQTMSGRRDSKDEEAWEWTQTMIGVVWAHRYVFFHVLFFFSTYVFFCFLGSYYVITTKHAQGQTMRHGEWIQMTSIVI